jgi:hypothetical protein
MTTTTAAIAHVVPAAVIDAAVDAAFPGLPKSMSPEEARRRVIRALESAYPAIAKAVLSEASANIVDLGRQTGDAQTARAYERAARGE